MGWVVRHHAQWARFDQASLVVPLRRSGQCDWMRRRVGGGFDAQIFYSKTGLIVLASWVPLRRNESQSKVTPVFATTPPSLPLDPPGVFCWRSFFQKNYILWGIRTCRDDCCMCSRSQDLNFALC